MSALLRLIYPIFAWLILATFGLEAIDGGLWFQVAVVALALAGLSQSFWKVQVQRTRPYATIDIVSFIAVTMSAVLYIALVIWRLAGVGG